MSKEQAAVKKIPYGVSDYEKIVTGNYYYVDKTAYLRAVEAAGDYLFFIRPRRFGKSLFLSLMETYYDIAKADRFEAFFKNTDIFKDPTPEKNAYLILKFNFSLINPGGADVRDSFREYVKEAGEAFISKYRKHLDVDEAERIKELKSKKTASDTLRYLIWLCNKSRRKVFVIIDEYDNFANTILSVSGSDDYRDLTHGEGFFRAFFNVLKGGASGSAAPISRLFLCGVSPITMDDVTSGYNIGENISIDPAFNAMLGFHKADIETMLEHYRAAGMIRHTNDELMGIMERWYGSYRFSTTEDDTMYNTDMVLYFLKNYFKTTAIPGNLIDRNVRIDYGKLRHLIIVERKDKKEANGNFSRLRKIVEEGEIKSALKDGFPLDELETPENFASLLYYFGLLTIAGRKEGLTLFKIPNLAIKHLYYDYIARVMQETGLLEVNVSRVVDLLHDMAYHGRWKPFFDYISERLKASTSIRDFIREEKVIQGFLLAYMGLSDFFIVHSEKELSKGYADIVTEPFLAGYEGIKYSYALEIKYIKHSETQKTGDLEKQVQQLRVQAEEQLEQYVGDEKYNKSIGKTTLIKLVLIFSGDELKYIGEV